MRHWELQELAALACGRTVTQWEDMQNQDREHELYDLVYEKFGCDFDSFERIAESLLLLTPKVQSPLTGEAFNAFVFEEEERFIIRSKPTN